MQSHRDVPFSASDAPRIVRVAMDVRPLQGTDAFHGIGHYTRGLAESLLSLRKELGLEIHLIYTNDRPAPVLRNVGAAHGVSCVDGPESPRRFEEALRRIGLPSLPLMRERTPANARALVAAARKCRADVLHVASPLHGRVDWKPVARPRCVATVYDLIPLLHRTDFLDQWPQSVRELYLKRLTMLQSLRSMLAISRTVAADLAQHARIPAERIHVAYPGLRFAAAPEERAFAPVERERFLLAFASRNPSKNLEGLLRGYALLPHERRRNTRLVLAGAESPETQAYVLEAEQRFGLAGELDLRGTLSDDELADLYRRAALFLLPSTAEGFGLPALEAMAHGTPVAASRLPVLEEVLGDAAFYFDPRDPFSLARAVQDALASPSALAAVSEKGRERAASFTWERTARAVAEVYREAAGLA
jgi:glycosyltransferase involved in cell wall biosynthesis